MVGAVWPERPRKSRGAGALAERFRAASRIALAKALKKTGLAALVRRPYLQASSFAEQPTPSLRGHKCQASSESCRLTEIIELPAQSRPWATPGVSYAGMVRLSCRPQNGYALAVNAGLTYLSSSRPLSVLTQALRISSPMNRQSLEANPDHLAQTSRSWEPWPGKTW